MAKKPDWTGEVLALMHTNDITQKQLAAELGVSKVWVSMMMNGHATPQGAEEKIRSAVSAIIARA